MRVLLWSTLLSEVDSMETIQVVLDRKLLQAADRAARRTRQNRSALIRDALRQHLRSLEVRELEQRDREGYTKGPQRVDENAAWETEASWPKE
jgi:metal-responsive CopG/Arc/MetJ family transcriptional regulator